MNITDIVNTAPNNWISEFTAIPTGLQQKGGGAGKMVFYVGKLTDPQFPSISIDATFFRSDALSFQDQVCHFSGKSMKRDEYQGSPKITIGDKATIQKIGIPTNQPPVQSYQPVQARTQPVTQSAKKTIPGIQVGMAINNAGAILAANPNAVDGQHIQEKLLNLASDIIRIAHAIEAGNLAPTISSRSNQTQPTPQQDPPQAPQQAPTESQVNNVDSQYDSEDMPF